MAAPHPKPSWRIARAEAQVESWALRVVAAPPPVTNWTTRGNCAGRGLGSMHPRHGGSAIVDNQNALKVCWEGGPCRSQCPVLLDCLRATIHAEFPIRDCHGVAGGMTAPFRRKVLKVLVARVRVIEAQERADRVAAKAARRLAVAR